MDTPASADEIWTVGDAVAYLNAGPVNLRVTRKRVRAMADDPACQIRSIRGGTSAAGRRTWYRLVASTVRAERARLLRESGYEDPDWPVRSTAG
jgi:hypothetical protein